MPGMIGLYFTKLTYLDVGGNAFENGDLDVSRLPLLTTLGMYETKLNGSVPVGIGALTALT
jgi:Leucine-rich repeat (LRR) protein